MCLSFSLLLSCIKSVWLCINILNEFTKQSTHFYWFYPIINQRICWQAQFHHFACFPHYQWSSKIHMVTLSCEMHKENWVKIIKTVFWNVIQLVQKSKTKHKRLARKSMFLILSLKSFIAQPENNFGRFNAKLNHLLYDFLHNDSNISYSTRGTYCSHCPHTYSTKILLREKEKNKLKIHFLSPILWQVHKRTIKDVCSSVVGTIDC